MDVDVLSRSDRLCCNPDGDTVLDNVLSLFQLLQGYFVPEGDGVFGFCVEFRSIFKSGSRELFSLLDVDNGDADIVLLVVN